MTRALQNLYLAWLVAIPGIAAFTVAWRNPVHPAAQFAGLITAAIYLNMVVELFPRPEGRRALLATVVLAPAQALLSVWLTDGDLLTFVLFDFCMEGVALVIFLGVKGAPRFREGAGSFVLASTILAFFAAGVVVPFGLPLAELVEYDPLALVLIATGGMTAAYGHKVSSGRSWTTTNAIAIIISGVVLWMLGSGLGLALHT